VAQQPLDVGPEIGIRIGFYPLRFAGVEGEAELLPMSTESGASALLWGARLQAVARLPGRFSPFALIGLGSMGVSSDGSVLASDTDTVGHLGVGGKVQVNPWVSFRVDGRLLRAPAAMTDSGTNHFSVMLGVSLTLGRGGTGGKVVPPDRDEDGVADTDDACPATPGRPPDGCPPGDTDRDGLADDVDRCPAEAETANGHEDNDGCPDELPDRDGDGVPDASDACIDQPEDQDGFEDPDGCADLDNDGDGVLDAADLCPREIGPHENLGCADTDRDGDGVVDRLDNCPDQPGTATNHGCQAKQFAVIGPAQIRILDKVYFDDNRAAIQRRSHRLLDNVAQVLNNHPEIQLVRIEGHTDDRGNDDSNLDLSRRRAEAVMSYLVDRGVPAQRLDAAGLGEERPIASNATAHGRAVNRRVEFHIVPIDPSSGSAE
jgi:outer membrane protein OmpA-like peptidoglycan-associated protein